MAPMIGKCNDNFAPQEQNPDIRLCPWHYIDKGSKAQAPTAFTSEDTCKAFI